MIKIMKQLVLILTSLLVTGLLHAQPDGWLVNSADYEYSMTLTATVELDGTSYGAEGDVLAAFAGDQCRGVAQASYVEAYDSYMFFLTVFSNVYSDEEIQFKLYEAANDQVLEGFNPISFEEGKNLGTASAPFPVSDQVSEDINQATFRVLADGNPLEGATVEINGESLTANASGEAAIWLEDGSYPYTVSAQDYSSENGTLVLAGEDVTEEVCLVKNIFSITFNVTQSGSPVAGAEITIDGNALTTATNGLADTELLGGTYSYTVTAEGMEDYQGALALNENMVENVNLTLITALPQNQGQALALYPNPAHGQVHISGENLRSVSLLNLQGQSLLQKQAAGSRATLPLDKCTPGLYLLQIRTLKGMHHKTLLVE